MNNPLTLLIIGVIVVLLSIYLFLPGKGFFARKKQAKKNSIRVLIEDALKHLYDCEYRNLTCTINSISGSLAVSSDLSATIIERLEHMGLLSINVEKLELTSLGRTYALKVIRIHRLWEKYLADETSANEIDWHNQAELIEHKLSLDQADKLAAQLGNPLYDPHGDPIPTAEGEIFPTKGKPLTSMNENEIAQIIHVEDEPEAIYSQLIAEGLYSGLQIRMTENRKDLLKFEANGEEIILSPLLAANITVADIPKEERVIETYRDLSTLSPGNKATILGIAKACRGQQRRRLMDLGVVPGSGIETEFTSAGGDPVAYKIKGATIALRKKTARHIFIEDVKEKEVEIYE